MYVTANRIGDAMGLIQVHDAEHDYRHVGDHLLDGIGPHEIGLMPDGETLVVALGGIRTHPDSGRAKLNLGDMDPALLLLNRHSGEIRERHRPSHHQLSCRHLDIAPDGSIVAGYQFQGPEWETDHPLIARRAPDGSFSEQALPSPLQSRLAQYTASVAASQVRPSAAISAPRGNKVLVLGRASGELLAQFDIVDAAGVRCDGAGGYLVTTGGGEVHPHRRSRTPSPTSRLAAALGQPSDLSTTSRLSVTGSSTRTSPLASHRRMRQQHGQAPWAWPCAHKYCWGLSE